MYLANLSDGQLARAYEAADCLLGLPVRLDAELAVKLDTLRADLTAAIEDRQPAGRIGSLAKVTGQAVTVHGED